MKSKKQIFIYCILIFCLSCTVGCGANKDTNKGSKKNEGGATTSAITTTSALTSDSAISSDAALKTEEAFSNENAVTKGKETSSASGSLKEKTDKYQTAPVPQGKPVPVEPQKTEVNKKKEYHCTISISCKTILDNMDDLDPAKLEILPKGGIISDTNEVKFYEGESVFDVLLRATKDKKIHMEFVSTPLFNSNYIEGINNLYEFDCGELSGWMYRVNDWFPNYGCSRYLLKDGDEIEWLYTCDLGRDIGGDWAAQTADSDEKSVEQ